MNVTDELAYREEDALRIANYADFRELLIGYEHNGEWVAMDQPRQASYAKENADSQYETIPLVQDDFVQKVLDGVLHSCACPFFQTPRVPVEHRAITLTQLRAIKANVIRRCIAEEWVDYEGKSLSIEKVTLYDINRYIILPFTVKTKRDLVSTMPSTSGHQPPRWFTSHWWGEPMMEFMDCVETFVEDFKRNYNSETEKRGGGMTADTPIWICAYANCQWDLDEDITENPFHSGFTLAMRAANFRTLTILDKEGEVFHRIWCILELFLTLVYPDYCEDDGNPKVWAVYTALKHELRFGFNMKKKNAVGIVNSGGATNDMLNQLTLQRESFFPFHLVVRALSIQVQNAQASVESDRIHILNAIVEKDLCINFNADPPSSHEEYDILNEALRAAFATSQGILKRAPHVDGGRHWKSLLTAMSKGRIKSRMQFNFREGSGWDNMSTEQTVEMIQHLPLTIEKLDISYASHAPAFFIAVSEWIESAKNLKRLEIQRSKFDDEGINRLLEAIDTSPSISYVCLVKIGMKREHFCKLAKVVIGRESMRTLWIGEGRRNDEAKAWVEQVKGDTRSRISKVQIRYWS